jgi:hypothetical protein
VAYVLPSYSAAHHLAMVHYMYFAMGKLQHLL